MSRLIQQMYFNLKLIDRNLERLFLWVNKSISGRIFIKLALGIILALLISLSSLLISNTYSIIIKNKVNLEKIEEISIGVNEEFVISKLGQPKYKAYSSEYDTYDCYYLLDGVVLRLFINNQRVDAFFVTITDEKLNIKMNPYSHLINGSSLGRFTFSDIDYPPEEIFAFVQNGTGFSSYVEKYYFASTGNYKDFLFANLTYGIMNFEMLNDNDYISEYNFGDSFDYVSSNVNIQIHPYTIDRNKSYPNTIGIINNCDMAMIYDLLFDFQSVDYFSLLSDIDDN